MKDFEITESPVAYLASSGKEVAEIVGISSGLSRGREFVLLLDEKKGLLARLLPAYLNSHIRYSESCLKARSLQMETLLFAAGTLRLDKAIRECGVKSGRCFLVFASSEKAFKAFRRKAGIKTVEKCELSFDLETAQKVASVGLLED